MLFNLKRQQKKEETQRVQPEIVPFHVGEVVTDGSRVGKIESIGISPYWHEEIWGVRRAYVVGLDREFADYWLV